MSGSHQGPQPERLHLEAGYMAAPVSFRERSDSFPLHRGRRPYMAHRVVRCDAKNPVAIGGTADIKAARKALTRVVSDRSHPAPRLPASSRSFSIWVSRRAWCTPRRI